MKITRVDDRIDMWGFRGGGRPGFFFFFWNHFFALWNRGSIYIFVSKIRPAFLKIISLMRNIVNNFVKERERSIDYGLCNG